jgi:hypothetical protein
VIMNLPGKMVAFLNTVIGHTPAYHGVDPAASRGELSS